jgi:hypothetical protein
VGRATSPQVGGTPVLTRTRSKPESCLNVVQQLVHGISVEQPSRQADRPSSVRSLDPDRVPGIARDLATRRCESNLTRLKKAAAAVVILDGVDLGCCIGVSGLPGRPAHDGASRSWCCNGHSRRIGVVDEAGQLAQANGQRGSGQGVSLDTLRIARREKHPFRARSEGQPIGRGEWGFALAFIAGCETEPA